MNGLLKLSLVMPSVSEASLIGHEMEVPRLTPRNDMEGETPRLRSGRQKGTARDDISRSDIPRHPFLFVTSRQVRARDPLVCVRRGKERGGTQNAEGSQERQKRGFLASLGMTKSTR
jgi:hypothetical protein